MESQTQLSSNSVWTNSQQKTDEHEKHKESSHRSFSGQLVAVTSTGPIYKRKAKLAVLPISVGLALIQELAARALNPKARVVSSLANRVGGDRAMSAWASTCGFMSGGLIGASPRTRLMFLNQVLTYARRQGNINGIEPIVGAAINAAWPWIEPVEMVRVLTVISKYMRKSTFASASTVPVLDPNTRTFTLFAPGDLAKIDPDEWREWRSHALPADPGLGGLGGLGGNDLLDQLTDLLGQHGRGPNRGNPGGNGGLGGPGGPGGPGGNDLLDQLTDLLGQHSRGPNRGNPGGNGGLGGNDLLDQLTDLLGQHSRGPNRNGGLGGDLGSRGGLDLGNLGGNGGPYGYGSGLGAGGASDFGEHVFWHGVGHVAAGFVLVIVGVATAPEGVGVAIATAGGFAIADGVTLMAIGAGLEEPESPKSGTGATSDTQAAPAPSPQPKPEDPKPEDDSTYIGEIDDLYPNPNKLPDSDGSGGGNPTQLPDSDGSGGGNPLTLWDENGGGGNPLTLWDENGGGGNPTTTAEFVSATVLTGRGLLSSIVQVGPTTFAF